jgi:hypothetical protein
LEHKVIEYIMSNETAKLELLQHYATFFSSQSLSGGSIDGNFNSRSESSSHSSRTKSTAAGECEKLRVCIAAMRQQEEWGSFVNAAGSLLGIKDLLLLEWYERFGGRVFVPVTGGGHTSEEVLQWMVLVFMPPTALLKEQSSRVKNAYGLSEFPGISVNGTVNSTIELELVPVPEQDVLSSVSGLSLSSLTHHAASNPDMATYTNLEIRSEKSVDMKEATAVTKVVCRRGERFDPSVALGGEDGSIRGCRWVLHRGRSCHFLFCIVMVVKKTIFAV